MPLPQLKAYAKKYDVPLLKVKKFWSKAKKQYGEEWEKVSGAVKKMCKNYQKSLKENVCAADVAVPNVTRKSPKKYRKRKRLTFSDLV